MHKGDVMNKQLLDDYTYVIETRARWVERAEALDDYMDCHNGLVEEYVEDMKKIANRNNIKPKKNDVWIDMEVKLIKRLQSKILGDE